MFGYVTIDLTALSEEGRKRYQAYYCGLCRTLKARFGNIGRVTLSNDMTFLYMLLSALYEPEEQTGAARCPPHPLKPRPWLRNEYADYCADMNIALAYHKCRDDWADDHSLTGRAEAAMLAKAYGQVKARHPEKCAAIERCLTDIGVLEKAGSPAPDAPANLTARMLGEVFACKADMWAVPMRAIGEGLGRFVYLMDAYDDLKGDLRRRRYNPLIAFHGHADFETLCRDALTYVMAEATQAFEVLPLLRDADIMRNILYAGVWMRYWQKQARPDRKAGKLKESDHEQGPV
jgi:hypothetical protein